MQKIFLPTMIKNIAGINHHGKRIRMIDKRNVTETCPVCGENERSDHVALCEKNLDHAIFFPILRARPDKDKHRTVPWKNA